RVSLLSESELEADVLTFDVAKIAKPSTKRFHLLGIAASTQGRNSCAVPRRATQSSARFDVLTAAVSRERIPPLRVSHLLLRKNSLRIAPHSCCTTPAVTITR